MGMRMALGRHLLTGGMRVPGPMCALAQSKAAPGSEGRWLQLSRDLLKSLQVTNVSWG